MHTDSSTPRKAFASPQQKRAEANYYQHQRARLRHRDERAAAGTDFEGVPVFEAFQVPIPFRLTVQVGIGIPVVHRECPLTSRVFAPESVARERPYQITVMFDAGM